MSFSESLLRIWMEWLSLILIFTSRSLYSDAVFAGGLEGKDNVPGPAATICAHERVCIPFTCVLSHPCFMIVTFSCMSFVSLNPALISIRSSCIDGCSRVFLTYSVRLSIKGVITLIGIGFCLAIACSFAASSRIIVPCSR
ncbi:hypothetical protein B0J14DRAFT_601398 [Halenospora varia]|nr:hypothetical protein B0J14DRAFT_601398 [Halenospora varia]